jgi:Wiskott-Aldrich syndrome protein
LGGHRAVYFPFEDSEPTGPPPPPPRSPCYEAPRSPGRIASVSGRCYSPIPPRKAATASPSPQRSSTPSMAGSPSFHSPTPSRNLSPNQLSPSARSPVMPRSPRGSCRSPIPPRSPMGYQPIPTTPRSPSPSPLPQRTTR